VLLTLDVGDEQPFHYRPIDGAPKAAKHPRMHLLDGQQRMTAVWKALTNGFADRLFFVNTDPDEAEEENQENDDSALHVTVENIKPLNATERSIQCGPIQPLNRQNMV